MSFHRFTSGILCASALICFGAVAQAALSPDQKRTLAECETLMKNIESNLKLAQKSAGTADPIATSKARLAGTQLGQVTANLPQTAERLARLPADDADVAAMQKRFDAAKQAASDLEARIAGKPQVAAPPAAGDGVKLDYRQEESLKNARYHVREVEGRAGGVADALAKMKAVADPGTIDVRLAKQAMDTIEDARRRAKNATDQLANLPPNGRGVAEVRQALDAALASLDASETDLKPIYDKLAKATDPGSYPTMQADSDRLRELAQMFSDPMNKLQRRLQAAETVKQAPAAKEEAKRILTTYAAIIQQQTGEGRRFEGQGRFFDEQYAAFMAAADREKQALPAQIKEQFEKVNTDADNAVKNETPAWFSGGIPQQLEQISENVTLLAALDPAAAEPLAAQLKKTEGEMKQRVDSLKSAIIAANQLPPDTYTAGDRAELEKLATETWKKVEPTAKVIKICIPSATWERHTYWRYESSTWYKIDKSKLQVSLIVQQDDMLAIRRPVDLWKDHLKNDLIQAVPFYSISDEVPPTGFIPMAKVK